MRKAVKQIALGTVVLVLLCVAVRFVFFNSFSLYFPITHDTDENADQWAERISIDNPEVLSTGTAVIPILIADEVAHVQAIELNPIMAATARRSVELNELNDRITISTNK